MSDHYQTMGVAPTATTAEIKDAYHRLAWELHPDRNQGDKVKETCFKEVTAAYEVLSDPVSRAGYDHQRRPPPAPPPPPRPAPSAQPAPIWPGQTAPTARSWSRPTRSGSDLGALLVTLFGGALLANAFSNRGSYYDPNVDRTRGPDGRFRR